MLHQTGRLVLHIVSWYAIPNPYIDAVILTESSSSLRFGSGHTRPLRTWSAWCLYQRHFYSTLCPLHSLPGCRSSRQVRQRKPPGVQLRKIHSTSFWATDCPRLVGKRVSLLNYPKADNKLFILQLPNSIIPEVVPELNRKVKVHLMSGYHPHLAFRLLPI
jgi:hypothetical protein